MLKDQMLFKGLFVLLVYLTASATAQLPDGFAVWSEGDAESRTITMRKLKSDGTMGDPVKVVNKGDKGGDIQSQISFDGKWLAFTRSLGARNKYGGDDYHEFEKWDLYVVHLDGSFPAEAKKVARGYWPSWADDSNMDTKTLYYSTHHDSKTIRKVTIDNSGIVSGTDTKVQDIPGSVANQKFVGFAMMAPNGKFMAWRGSNVCLYFFEDWMGKKKGDGYQSAKGCMPSITADSRWVLNAYHRQTRVGKTESSTGKGDYHFGSSQDLNWYINRTQGGADVQNKGYDVTIFAVTIKDKEAKEYFDDPSDLVSSDYSIASKGVSITKQGSWPDVHVNVPTAIKTSHPIPTTGKNVTIELAPDRLIVNNVLSEPVHVSVFNLFGKKVGNFNLQAGNLSSVLFTNRLSDGFYFIRIKSVSYQEVIGKIIKN